MRWSVRKRNVLPGLSEAIFVNFNERADVVDVAQVDGHSGGGDLGPSSRPLLQNHGPAVASETWPDKRFVQLAQPQKQIVYGVHPML